MPDDPAVRRLLAMPDSAFLDLVRAEIRARRGNGYVRPDLAWALHVDEVLDRWLAAVEEHRGEILRRAEELRAERRACAGGDGKRLAKAKATRKRALAALADIDARRREVRPGGQPRQERGGGSVVAVGARSGPARCELRPGIRVPGRGALDVKPI